MTWSGCPMPLCDYLEKTGDESILTVPVRYLTAPELEPGEMERYLALEPVRSARRFMSTASGSLDRAWRLGELEQPLIGCGDWNDGFNRVGNQGARHERLAGDVFMAHTMDRMVPSAAGRGMRRRPAL
jgi:cyclic beta-1,2-glucan synthetase